MSLHVRVALTLLTLALDPPLVHSANLAIYLGIMSLILSDLGRNQEALAIIKESVSMWRQLAQDHPHVHYAGLASNLVNMSINLSGLGRNQEPLVVI